MYFKVTNESARFVYLTSVATMLHVGKSFVLTDDQRQADREALKLPGMKVEEIEETEANILDLEIKELEAELAVLEASKTESIREEKTRKLEEKRAEKLKVTAEKLKEEIYELSEANPIHVEAGAPPGHPTKAPSEEDIKMAQETSVRTGIHAQQTADVNKSSSEATDQSPSHISEKSNSSEAKGNASGEVIESKGTGTGRPTSSDGSRRATLSDGKFDKTDPSVLAHETANTTGTVDKPKPTDSDPRTKGASS